MNLKSLAVAAAACLAVALAASPARAVESQIPHYVVLKEDASIPFALRRVTGYRVGKDRSLILDVGPRWYRAELDSFCARDLRWTHRIGLLPGGIGSFDRFSRVIVDGRRCFVRSVDEIADPRPAERAAREAARHGRYEARSEERAR